MKKTMMILLGILGANTNAIADKAKAEKLTPLQKIQIEKAIAVLVKTKTIESPYDQCVQFDQDILSILESESLIQTGTVQPMVICVEPK